MRSLGRIARRAPVLAEAVAACALCHAAHSSGPIAVVAALPYPETRIPPGVAGRLARAASLASLVLEVAAPAIAATVIAAPLIARGALNRQGSS